MQIGCIDLWEFTGFAHFLWDKTSLQKFALILINFLIILIFPDISIFSMTVGTLHLIILQYNGMPP